MKLDVDQIQPNALQPRLVFEPGKLEELAASIKENGVIQPIVVRQRKGGYEIIAGERRCQETTPPWPIMPAGTYDISRDRMMALPKANPIQFACACSPQEVDRAGWIQASIANVPGKAKHPGRESRVL